MIRVMSAGLFGAKTKKTADVASDGLYMALNLRLLRRQEGFMTFIHRPLLSGVKEEIRSLVVGQSYEMRDSVHNLAQGRWGGILPILGIDPKFLTGKQGPCPLCQGKTRARYDDKNGRGSWICNHCGAGSGLDLLMKFHGWDFRTAAQRVEEIVGVVPLRPIAPERPEADKRLAMRRLWDAGVPIVPGDPAGLWLRRRVGLMAFPKALRYAERVRYAGDYRPAMLAAVRAPDGSGSTIHRTFLTSDGHKAAVEKPRMVMPGHIEPGSAVRLFDPATELGIAEGIETAFAAASLFGVPCWSALNAGLMAKWLPPEGTEAVIVFADNDASFTGQEAAFALARRLTGKGIRVRVEIPERVDADWNDILLDQARAA